MTQISFTQEELDILVHVLERRKGELRDEEGSGYVRQLIKQILEKLEADV